MNETTSKIKTGFAGWDKHLQELYTGIHMIASWHGYGATSLTLQLARQMALQGRDVLFLILGKKDDILLRGISQLECMQDPKSIYTTDYLEKHFFADDVSGIISAYYQSELRFHLGICNLSSRQYTPGMIGELIKEVGRNNPNYHPVVFIDSLDLLAPDKPRKGFREDEIVEELVQVSIDHTIPIFITYSLQLSPTFAHKPISVFAACPESGNIAMTSVSLLQPTLFSDEEYRGMSLPEREAALHIAMAQNPRKMELVNLKNKYGPSEFKLKLDFYPKYGFFKEIGE